MRFKYYPVSQIIEDKCTGKRYYGNQAVADLLNELHEENKELKKENEQLKKAIDEADDLIKSHLSAHYNRRWENICEHLGVDLND